MRKTDPNLPEPLPWIARWLPPGFYYGWAIVAGCFALSFVVVGIGFYGVAVFLDALCNERGWSRTTVSAATTLYQIVTGLTSIAIGRWVDRFGARGFILAGVVIMAAALVVLSGVQRPGELLWIYPLLALGFAMAGSVGSIAILTRWFLVKRARAMSLAQTGVSVGGIVLVPLATALASDFGFATMTRSLAAILLVVGVPVTLFVLRSGPEKHGLTPDGIATGKAAGGTSALLPARAPVTPWAPPRSWSRSEAIRTPTLWLLIASFGGILFSQTAFLFHQIAFLREPLGTEAAALAVSATAAGSVVGRLVVGSFADRVRMLPLGAALFVLQAAALFAFTLSPGALGLYIASAVLGLTIGNVFMLQSLLVAQFFGAASFATVFGVQTLATQLVGGLGPLALGLAYAEFGGYEAGVRVLAGVGLVSSLLLLAVRPPPVKAG